ncbi:MAG TPA: endolytic transglycosylase MltG [Bacteroidetes bacterium]|nr:endolytic transglycosylase MltG [Bacteroidota bacterium]
MRKTLTIAAILAVLIGAGIVAWIAFLPNAPVDEAVGVKLPAGTEFEAAIDSLQSAGAIGSATSLRVFGSLTGWGDQVKPGHYRIQPGMNNWAMLDKIRKGLQDPVRITLPAGRTAPVIARAIADQMDTDSSEVMAALFAPDLAEQLDTDTLHLFAEMRGNTYDVMWTQDARRAVSRIHEWHERFWTDERLQKARDLGLTPDEVVTMASIVEWEARYDEEKPRIAGVYLNRLLGRTGARMRLQADPTVQYALMQTDGGPMRRLFLRDYQFPHPYNTYQIDGLPPGPINNPSDAAIDAVLDNEEHDYLYFVASPGKPGYHDFSETGAEHARKARAWSQYLSEQVRLRNARERAEAAQAELDAVTGD